MVVRKWLDDLPKTVIFDRSNFIVNAQAFQQRLNDNAPLWPILNNVPDNELIAVFWQRNWHRAAFKCKNNRNSKTYLQLVDSSVVLTHERNGIFLVIRRIMDPEILNAPWGRAKGYIFGVKNPYYTQTNVPQTTIDIFDEFFGNRRTVIAVLVDIPQDWDRLRHVYKCDFIADLGNGFQSLRSRLLSSGDGWTQATHSEHLQGKPKFPEISQNIAQINKVEEIINRMNLARTGSDLLRTPLQSESRSQYELRSYGVSDKATEKGGIASAALPFKFTIGPEDEVLLHHLIWELNTDGGYQFGEKLGSGSVSIGSIFSVLFNAMNSKTFRFLIQYSLARY